MIKVGITGGIGSGKSVVAKIIESLGYPVFNSDDAAKSLVNSFENIRGGLIDLFGSDLYNGKELNKPRLAEIIFSNDKSRAKVNALIHPEVRSAFDKFCAEASTDIVFNEAAILFETGGNEFLDQMILVIAPRELKIARVCNRDKVQMEDVVARMEKQWSDEQKIPLADYIIVNDETEPLLTQVEKVIKNLESFR
ncbi:MAG: dephospho-CoA kinase [Crocinitomicaceae bacterium]|nr:dephospho-CoA kinase [Crocinitomicaceae bacterium]